MMKMRISAAFIAVALLLCCCACGKNAPENEFSGGQSQTDPAQAVVEQTGAGFNYNHVVEAGFALGSDTPADVAQRFGQPTSQDRNDYTSVSVASMEYPFGYFEFEGAPGSEPVLTYVQIFSQIAPPCGLSFSDDLEQAAEKIFAGSGAGLKAAEGSQKYFYGSDSAGEEYGRYDMLTIEFISSTTNDTYALEYRCDAYEAGKMAVYTIFFDSSFAITNYTLRYM